MPEVLEVFLPNTAPWWILFLTLGIPLAAGLITTWIDYWDWEWFGAGVVIAVVATLFGGLFIGLGQNNSDEDRIQDALNKVGFSETSYSSGEFTAVYEGDRVKGILEKISSVDDNYTYQIVIIPPLSK